MNYKRWLLVTVVLFGIGVILGLVVPAGNASFLDEDMASLGELAAFFFSFPPALTATFIFAKNALALLLSFALSPILCIVPVATLILNGGLLSFVSVVVIQEESLGFLLAGLLPHGIIELPAFIIGEAAALGFGAMVVLALFKKEKRQQVPLSLKRNFRYLLVALILLIPAAIIETFITPLLLT